MAASGQVVYRVREAFTFDADGRPYSLRRGELVSAGHPAVTKARMSLLEEVSADAVRADTEFTSIGAVQAVETTTAVPGERRTTRPPTGASPAARTARPVADNPQA